VVLRTLIYRDGLEYETKLKDEMHKQLGRIIINT